MSPHETYKMLLLVLSSAFLPLSIFAASIATKEEPCPVNSDYCNCSEGPFYVVKCTNISDIDTLHDVVKNLTEKTFIFEIALVNWTSFPLQALRNPYLMSMVINNSTFDTLFNHSLLADTANSSILHHLSLENVTFTHWSWNQMNLLKKLDILFSYNTTIGDKIPRNFSRHVSPTLKFLSISQSNISTVEPESLKDLRNLTYLRISHSKLTTLSRNILPYPSRLGQLRLDHNSIVTLPDDMFQNMPNLTVVSLSNNRISILSEELFRPLWNSTTYLELRNNPIKCDCRMKWVVTSPNKPNIIGACAYPKRLFHRNIKSLTVADFNC